MRRRTFLAAAASTALAATLRGGRSEDSLGTLTYTQRDGLWVRDLPDGSPRRLVEGTKLNTPRFSPSGNWISYLDDESARVVSLDGNQNHGFGEVDRGSAVPGSQWIRNRDELLVGAEQGVRIFTAASQWKRPTREIASVELPVVFSPDGREIVYGDETGGFDGEDGQPPRTGRLSRLEWAKPDAKPSVLVSKVWVGQVPAVWIRDGGILFWQDPDFSGSAIADGLKLSSVSATGGEVRDLGVTTLLNDDVVVFGSEGQTLAIQAGGGRNHWEDKRIAVLDLATFGLSYVTEERLAAVSPSWSADGSRITYSAAPEAAAHHLVSGGDDAKQLLARRRIWSVNPAGKGTPEALTHDQRYRDEKPMWSADGKHILFCRMDDSDAMTLWTMNADGASPLQVAGPLYAEGPLGDDSWFGYYGYIDWRAAFDWRS